MELSAFEAIDRDDEENVASMNASQPGGGAPGGPRATERRLREEVHREEPQVVPGSGRRLAPAAMAQMVSARLEGRLVAEIRRLAEETGVSLSELLRRGAEMVLAEARSNPTRVTWEVRSAPARSVAPEVYPTIEGGSRLIVAKSGPTLSGSTQGRSHPRPPTP